MKIRPPSFRNILILVLMASTALFICYIINSLERPFTGSRGKMMIEKEIEEFVIKWLQKTRYDEYLREEYERLKGAE